MITKTLILDIFFSIVALVTIALSFTVFVELVKGHPTNTIMTFLTFFVVLNALGLLRK